ncbi:MAG TPA: ABC transporter permease [bacterium]|nr:ABC transporter permease [bacterium]
MSIPLAAAVRASPGPSSWRRGVAGGKLGLAIGLVLVVLAGAAAVGAPVLAPRSPQAADLLARLTPPAWLTYGSSYPLGTDAIGRDMLSRIIYGARISLQVGLLSVLLSSLAGTALGLLGGYYGGWLDETVMRAADLQLSFPFILFAIVVIAVLGPGLNRIILVLAVTQWALYARLVRSETLAVREADYIQAARAIGVADRRIIWRHVLPNALGAVLVLATLSIANNILLEASLTFLGLGVDPSVPSWGGMLAESRNYIQTAWWDSTFPGLAIMLTVMGFNLVGDWLRDRLNPDLR